MSINIIFIYWENFKQLTNGRKQMEWTKISDLPAWLRVKAKTNIALDKRRGGYSDGRKEDCLLYAFTWHFTPEGYDYWSRINKGIIPEKPNNNNG